MQNEDCNVFAGIDAAEKAKKEGVARVSGWLEQGLPDEERANWLPGGKAEDGKETSIIVNQLACMEEGCPDVELVCTLLRPKPAPKLMFKIYKAAKDLTEEEVAAAVKQAKEEEAKGAEGIIIIKSDHKADDCCGGDDH